MSLMKFIPRLLPPGAARVLTKEVLFDLARPGRASTRVPFPRRPAPARNARISACLQLWRQALYVMQHFHEQMSALPTAELLPQLHTLGKRLYVLSNYGPVGFARAEERFADAFSQFSTG